MIGCTSSVLGECTTGANHVHERPSVWLGFCHTSLYESVCHRLQLFWTERMRGHKILGNAHSNAAINVQNQVCSLASGNLFLGYRSQRPLTVLEIRECSEIVYAQPRAISLRFHCEGIVQHWCGFKVFLRKSLDDFHLRSSKKLSKMLRSP